ncbi:hypothetical protein F5Y16DRAFT_167167 [Xylariaceae sp. FL0255]|nr:hypothetical protein F5Y16DRAFT_167167 [Xylariaceae sp. FL0255]
MGLSREPSQRALNWVSRWNSTRSRNRPNASKQNPAPEPQIVHLGGARIGTAFEELDLPIPGRPNPADGERPVTQWAFGPQTIPNSTGIGIAVESPDEEPDNNTKRDESDKDRPITQWFHTGWQPPGKAKAEEQNRTELSKSEPIRPGPKKDQDPGLRTAFPYPASSESHNDDRLLSPLTNSYLTSNSDQIEDALVTPSTTASFNEPPSPDSATPFPLSIPIVAKVIELPTPQNVDTIPPRPAAFPKRSTSLSQGSRHAHSRPIRPGVARAADSVETMQLRRAKSNAEVQKSGSWRTQSTRRVHKPNDKDARIDESVSEDAESIIEQMPELKIESKIESYFDPSIKSEIPTEVEEKTQEDSSIPSKYLNPREVPRLSPNPSSNHSSQSIVLPLPPMIGPPPNVPLPQISTTKLAGQGKARDQLHRRDGSDRSKEGISPSSSPNQTPLIQPHRKELSTSSIGDDRSRERLSTKLSPKELPSNQSHHRNFSLSSNLSSSVGDHKNPYPSPQNPLPDLEEQQQQQQQQQQEPEQQQEEEKEPQQPQQLSIPPLPEQTSHGKMTSRERFWLHRHYRGEATFLKAWGLQITNNEDREEGLRILRELIRGEEEEAKERERSYLQYRSGTSSHASTITSSSIAREGNSPGLDVISEESRGRDSVGLPPLEDMQFWKTDLGNSLRSTPSFSNSSSYGRHRAERHARTESDNSVLGAYLDLRLSRDST